MNTQNRIIYFCLTGRKFSVDRVTARYVTGVISIFGTHIKEHEIAVITLVVVFDVVQYVGVISSGNDWGVRKAAAAVHQEFVHEFGLKFVFPNSRFQEFQNALVTLDSDCSCFAHDHQFFFALCAAYTMKYRLAALKFVGMVLFLDPLIHAVLTQFCFHMCSKVLVAIEVDTLGIHGHFIEDTFKIRQPENSLNATDIKGFFFGILGPFPNRDEVISFFQEKNFTKTFLVCIREQYKDAFFLICTA